MDTLKNKTAEELMQIYQTEDPQLAYEAFTELFGRYSRRVFSYLLQKCRNTADAEDLVQKVFMKMHESKHLYRSEFKFEQWLFVIARTSLFDLNRSNKKRDLKHEAFSHGLEEPANLQDLELGFMSSLKESERELITMKFIDEYNYHEMAKILHKSEVSLRKSVSRIIAKLKKEEVYE